jgi:hypothetical protein
MARKVQLDLYKTSSDGAVPVRWWVWGVSNV